MASMGKGIKYAVKEIDRGWKALRKTFQAIGERDSYVKVGVLAGTPEGDQQRKGGMTNVELAMLHEFGSSDGSIPERSFIRSTYEENKARYKAELKILLRKLYEGRLDVRNVLGILGSRMANDMKRKITSGEIKPPNTPSVIARKSRLVKRRKLRFDESRSVRRFRDRRGRFATAGRVRPLIDTGQLVKAIDYQVVMVSSPVLGGS